MTAQKKKHKTSGASGAAALRAPVFRRPALDSAVEPARTWRDALTFGNAVLVLGGVTVLIFLANAVSPRLAFLVVALGCIVGLVLLEMVSRRRWEAALLDHIRKMNRDYDRLVRDVARNRNDLAQLKKNLTSAGTLAQSYGRTQGDAVEQRMLRAIAGRLASIGAADAVEEGAAADDFPVFNAAVTDRDTRSDADAVGSRLSDEQVLQLLRAALNQDRIDVFLQPVVSLPQRKNRFFELYSRMRIKPGVYLPAARYVRVAQKHDLLPVIDNMLLLRGLQLIRDAQDEDSSKAYFCNVTTLTLNDPKFMGDLVEFLAQNRMLAPRMVFELGQRDLMAMQPETGKVLDGLARLGCRFSMDNVQALSFDFPFLRARHIRFVKVDAQMMIDEMNKPGGFLRMKNLKAEMDTNGIDLITTRVEREPQLLDILDIDMDYGQGYLFGKPEVCDK